MQRAHTDDGNGFHINATTNEPYYGVVDVVYYINRFGHEIQPWLLVDVNEISTNWQRTLRIKVCVVRLQPIGKDIIYIYIYTYIYIYIVSFLPYIT